MTGKANQSLSTDGHMPEFKRVGVLYHPLIKASETLAQLIASKLDSMAVESWLGLSWEPEEARARVADSDLLIVLGGDGSLLRAARIAAGHNTPLIGVNMGRLGFLSEMTPTNWEERLPRVLDGQCWLEERLMLETTSWRGDHLLGKHLALNDVVVSRGTLARVIRLRTNIDDDFLTTYTADGLIIATPTGSTAYALAVGGPILPPELRNFVVLPIAAHMSLNRAIVLSEGARVSMTVSTDHQAILTVDGQFEFELQDGDRVEVCRSKHTSRFVRLGERGDFYRTLLERLNPK